MLEDTMLYLNCKMWLLFLTKHLYIEIIYFSKSGLKVYSSFLKVSLNTNNINFNHYIHEDVQGIVFLLFLQYAKYYQSLLLEEGSLTFDFY